MKKPILIITFFLITTAAFAQNSINKPRLDSLLDVLAANNRKMVNMAISQNGKIIYQKSTGIASSGVKATANTKYRVGSISKMFTATIIFQLIDAGKLKLSDPLSKWYPQLPNAEKITIGLMLKHRSGLFNFTADSTYLTYYTQPQTEQQQIARFAKLQPAFAPDTKSAYSNTNYVLLAYIAQKITGKPYALLIKERITGRLKLNDTYAGGAIDPKKHEAQSYKYINGWQQETATDMSVPGGAGAIVSTPADLARFIEGLFNGKLVSDSSLNVMKTLDGRFGSGMFGYSFNEKSGFGHNGSIDSFNADLSYYPTEKLTIAICSNGGTYSVNNIGLAALKLYFGQPYQLPVFSNIKLNEADMDKYVGVYGLAQAAMKITVAKKDDMLTAQATGQNAFPLEPTAPGKFSFEPADIVITIDTAKKELNIAQGGHTTLFKKE
ncbi:beta-lactamase family protein [Mucilaginibacter sp. UR6-1]|uniref:serine hydrolase domain-containing protein n=1 Tax=Mucilaginibacter sp. UR6-1 TaxID=1435643 RepID=UPI001E5B1919|nr:serine hydrolase domain-containing protein [Mucilaginibacter sp. UR6-1]MCC8409882.1 beta-lactamase family protein [Mucilaginibacter sp. UR6-1]